MIVKNIDIDIEEKNKILRDADNILNGIYYFDGVWDMETFLISVNNKKIKWNIKYNGDPEWTYMFTRMDYLYKLIIAYELTNDNKYLNHSFKLINKWYKSNKKYLIKKIGKINDIIFKNNYAHRTLDIAILAANITDYIIYCNNKNIINERTYNNYKKKVYRIIQYVKRHSDEKFKSFNNWGIIENANIIYCNNKLYKKTDDSINSRLIRQINNQINSNGSQIECSPMYLVEILLVLIKLYNCSEKKLKAQIIKPIKKGLDYIINIRTLDNCIPNIGDSDKINISELMYTALIVLKDNYYSKFINKKVDIEYRIKYEKKVLYNNNQTNEDLINYKDQIIYRNINNKTYLICTNTQRKIDGHKHYDYMSFIYWEYGKEVLSDLGRYSYKNNSKRKFYVGPYAHNTINIKDSNFYEYITNWVTNQHIECRETKLEKNKEYFTIKMSCIFGYEEINISRYITYICNLGLIITDIINDKEKNNYESFFNIGKDFKLENNKITNISNEKECIYYSNSEKDSYKIKQVFCSKKYNEEAKTSQIYINTNKKKITHFFLKNNKKTKVEYKNDTIEYKIDNIIVRIGENNGI